SALLARVKTQLTLKEAVKARHLLWSLHQELDIARKIQNSFLLPPKPDWSQPAIVCFSAPASEVGGDFYLYHAFEGAETRRFALAVGDVTGKGIPAAMLMAGSIASLQAILPETLPPEQLLTKLDKAIGLHTQMANQNCALCYAELTVPRNGNGHHPPATLRVANAGCIPPLIRRAGGSTEWVDVVGLPLGLALGLSLGYEPATTELEPGDLVVLTSDGLVEATAANKELFGFERLEQAVAGGPATHPEAMVAHLRAEVSAFLGPAEIHDDVTIVVLQV
ncbi:MAG: SpoIIE family protein phosphatase, partial [Anaerolineae bacterium]|nr:SpoIIE family protein phosphatase [Anaerolineae bacterium]